MRRIGSFRVAVLFAGATVVLFALTVYLGTGGRADARCLSAFFVSGGEWSWTHMATRCEYGEPTRAGYTHSLAFLPMLVTAAAAIFQGYQALAQHRGWRRI